MIGESRRKQTTPASIPDVDRLRHGKEQKRSSLAFRKTLPYSLRRLLTIMPANPTLSPQVFNDARLATRGEPMTVQGAVNKTAVLLAITVVSAAYTWQLFWKGDTNLNGWIIGGALSGFIIAMITSFKPMWSPVTAPIYAMCEGLFIGALSSLFEQRLPGVVMQAVMLTFGTLAALLGAYSMGIIRATTAFRRGVIAATGGIFLLFLVSIGLSFFHIQIPGIFGSGPIGIVFSLVVVVIASLNLVLDFDMIESGARGGAPKYMEWYCGFALLVTLVWLYLEILRLLAKLNRRN
ncbi:MAG TPA: Bax inhibitor-1/YccA family protein [Chthoniobacter sp.]